MTETLCVKEDVQLKAGEHATELTDAEYTSLINQAEAFVCAHSRENWIDNYNNISDIAKEFLKDAVSCHAAISVIDNNMSGFTSRMEAQVMLDVLYSKLVDNINLLRDEKFRTFIIKGEVE